VSFVLDASTTLTWYFEDEVSQAADALMDRIKADPTLSQALPFLVLARGLAKPDGDGLAWDIAFDETKKVVVNGTDLSRIAGGGGQRQ